MKFRVNTSVLKTGLDTVSHATAGITTTPILENILIKVNFNSIVLSANNLEMAIEYIIKDDIEITSEGAFCIPGKLFISYISLINDSSIEIELLKDDSLNLVTESGKLKIKGIQASEFPLIPTIKEEMSFHISGETLKKSIEKTLFSSAEGNIRPTLAGILMNLDSGNVTCASTDSFRLSEYKTSLDAQGKGSFSKIIPSKTAFEIKSIIKEDDDIKVISGDNQIAFYFGNTKVFSRLLNGSFPDYSSFFPNSFSTKAEINRIDLIQALKKINLISKENNYSIKMSFSGEARILLESGESQIGEGDVRLAAAVEGEDNIIGINSTYFLEVLGVIESSHISIRFENALSPILITPLSDGEKKKSKGEFRHIIMPLKI